MFKWIGAVCVCIACGGIGFCMARELKERRELLAELKRCLLMLKGEVAFGAATLPQSLCAVGARTSGCPKAFFSAVGELLASHSQAALCDVWEQQANAAFAHSALHTEDRKWLAQLGARLQAQDKQTQMTTLDYLIEQIKQMEEAAQKSYAANARLFRCVGTMSGILIVLLLI